MQRYWSDSFSCGSIISDSRFNNSFCRILSKSISNIRYYLQKKYLHMVILSVTMCCCTLYAVIFIAYRVTGTLAMCELCLQVCAMCYLLFQAGRELIKASQQPRWSSCSSSALRMLRWLLRFMLAGRGILDDDADLSQKHTHTHSTSECCFCVPTPKYIGPDFIGLTTLFQRT